MHGILKHIILNMVTVFTVTMFFSCKNNFKEVQNIGVISAKPAGISEGINTKYTDSGRLKSHLISPKMLDFSNREFAFSEFPEGINLTMYDEEGKTSNVIADYAIIYNETDLIDLQGNVVISTHNKDTLFAEQLFYDQKKEWMFTNQSIVYKSQEQIINGIGFDANKDLTKYQVLETTGVIFIDE